MLQDHQDADGLSGCSHSVSEGGDVVLPSCTVGGGSQDVRFASQGELHLVNVSV